MQFSIFILPALVATVLAKGEHGNSTKAVSETSQCEEMSQLSKLVSLASNTTKLDQVTKNNATKVAEIQAKASTASTQLTAMQSNTTLTSFCAVVDAKNTEDDACQQTFMLQRFVAFAANTTAVANATSNNATKIADIELKASSAAAKLDTLTSNTTLQAACPAVMQDDECKAMVQMQKVVDLANNATKLADVTNGDASKEAMIKSEAAKAQPMLAAMEGNATFVAACNATSTTAEDSTTGANAAAATTTAAKSGAAALQGLGLGGLMMSSFFVLASGMFLV